MALQFKDGYITSIYGRRLGLQVLSPGQSGADTVPAGDFLIGPDGIKQELVTETTDVRVRASGMSILTTLATSHTKYTIDPPIIGVHKYVYFETTSVASDIQLITGADTWYFSTSAVTTATKLNSTQGVNQWVHLVGLTTARYGVVGPLSTAVINSTATT